MKMVGEGYKMGRLAHKPNDIIRTKIEVLARTNCEGIRYFR